MQKLQEKHKEMEEAEKQEQLFPPHPVHSDYPFDLDPRPEDIEIVYKIEQWEERENYKVIF